MLLLHLGNLSPPHVRLADPQPFRHQGLVSWKAGFPQTRVGDGSGGKGSDGEQWGVTGSGGE